MFQTKDKEQLDENGQKMFIDFEKYDIITT
jgi:hypothetical protein